MKTNVKNRLIVMVGLPQSGKSSEASLMKSPMVNRDAIRLAIGGSIRYFKEEDRVTELEGIMADSLFNAGHDEVIIDACHLKPEYRTRWKYWAKHRDIDINFYQISTSLETCMMRARRNFPNNLKFPSIIKVMWKKSTTDKVIPEFQKHWYSMS
jgi:predicted kinase